MKNILLYVSVFWLVSCNHSLETGLSEVTDNTSVEESVESSIEKEESVQEEENSFDENISIEDMDSTNNQGFNGNSWRYYYEVFFGVTIYYSANVIENHWNSFLKVRYKIYYDLKHISQILNSRVMNNVRRTHIFVNISDVNGRFNSAVFHPSKEWLSQNNYDPFMAGHVQIANLSNYIAWESTQPAMLLHELGHGVYFKDMSESQRGEVYTAYQSAMRKGLYQSVDYINGGKYKAYAATDEREYFSEGVEAFFMKNDYYPFDRNQLYNYDRELYNIISRIFN